MVIEIKKARSDRNAAEFYGYPSSLFYIEEIFALTCFHFFLDIEIHNSYIANNLCFNILFCRYIALVMEDY